MTLRITTFRARIIKHNSQQNDLVLMLSVILRVANEPFRLDVVKLNVIMLRVMAPIESECVLPENTKGGSITALLTSLCLTGLESAE